MKSALIGNKIVDYKTLLNININQYKDRTPIYKSSFETNTNQNKSNITKFPSLIWNNKTYTNFLFVLNYNLKYQGQLLFKYQQ